VNLFPRDLLCSSFAVLRSVALSNGFVMLKIDPPEVCLHARVFSVIESAQNGTRRDTVARLYSGARRVLCAFAGRT
jgi:hypothetical protein